MKNQENIPRNNSNLEKGRKEYLDALKKADRKDTENTDKRFKSRAYRAAIRAAESSIRSMDEASKRGKDKINNTK